MLNEKSPQVIEFLDLLKSIFVSQKAAAKALGVNDKTFSRLSVQQIPVYESQIESYINKEYQGFTFSIKEYKSARDFVAYYGEKIKQWFKSKQKQYKGQQAEFVERLYDSDDYSFVKELGDEYSETIISIRKEYCEYGTALRSWIKYLMIYKLYNSKANYLKAAESQMEQYKQYIDEDNCYPSNVYDILNFVFRIVHIHVVFDCLNISASLLNRSPRSQFIPNSWILIKRDRKNGFSQDESIGLWLPIQRWEKLQVGCTCFVNRNTDTGVWETKCVCLTAFTPISLSFVEIDSQNNLQQMVVFNSREGRYNLSFRTTPDNDYITTIFSRGFYVIPKEECIISEYIDNVIWENIEEDSYANESVARYLSEETYEQLLPKLESFFKGLFDR